MNSLGFNRFGREQRIQISDLSSNCHNLKDFQTFANIVEIESKQLPTSVGLKELQLLIKKNPIKWVIPVRKLCMRFIEEAKIINKLHLLFIKEAYRANCYFQALPVIDSEAIPTKMDSQQVSEYMLISFIIYVFMQMYSKANKKINEVITQGNRDFHKESKQYQVIAYLLFVRFYGGYIKKQSVYGAFGVETFMSPMRGGIINVSSGKVDTQKLALLQNFIGYANGDNSNFQFIQFYVSQDKTGLWKQLFRLGTTQSTKMRKKVTQFKQEKLQRLKTSSIHDRPLDKPQNMRVINLVSPMARYDVKQKCLYINHEKATDEQVNQLITKCYELNQALKQFKVVRESHFGGGLRGFGGLGGLSGLGGLGGFGGLLGRGM